jgi:hypothetical protein
MGFFLEHSGPSLFFEGGGGNRCCKKFSRHMTSWVQPKCILEWNTDNTGTQTGWYIQLRHLPDTMHYESSHLVLIINCCQFPINDFGLLILRTLNSNYTGTYNIGICIKHTCIIFRKTSFRICRVIQTTK